MKDETKDSEVTAGTMAGRLCFLATPCLASGSAEDFLTKDEG